ncbi:ExbD/TolR family protein [Prosthecodimorpha staleyi]|uniref:Biopolymer transporter ExbD n=1 Tax=Prosthecodimorpha staleyi TaxID=2840188 RepID=A0A947GB09_9HYPH|nr:biopolymer transporter ExbD [Prosthecodimorpha staleyi]MBT9289728.1 biopolymer transporter ExbD [Prosthecodimorpha staleyi]
MTRRPLRSLRPEGFRPLADINVTPLVDVMLVLLVVFMVTAPMLAAGLKVNLPRADTARALPPRAPPIVVTVTRDGGLSVDGATVGRDALVATLGSRLAGDGERVVHIRGDRDAPYGEIVSVIDLLAAGGISRLALVSRPHGPAAAAGPPAAAGTVP